ncbi:hypothetical protein [Acetobacter persici]|nr:hypothetical protein [Acetobacter persici]
MAQYTGTTASGLVYTASSTNIGVPPFSERLSMTSQLQEVTERLLKLFLA